jgi:hypothetical protein
MNTLAPRASQPNSGIQFRQHGGTNLWLLLAVFLTGAAIGALWITQYRNSRPQKTELSAASLQALSRLNAPVSIRFYSILDPQSAPDSLYALSARAAKLLSLYKASAPGKIVLVSITNASTFTPETATSDGIQPFTLGKGDPCFLGLSFSQSGHKETLPALSPDWAPALESDMTRAIARLSEAPSLSKQAPAPTNTPPVVSAAPTNAPLSAPTQEPLDPKLVADVRHIVSDIQATSVESGTRVIKETSLKELQTVVAEMNAKIARAKSHLSDAQTHSDPVELKTARDALQQLRDDQVETIRNMVVQTQARIETFQRMKNQ